MRFVPYVSDGQTLVAPEILRAGPSKPISHLSSFATPPLDPLYPFHRNLQEALEGKELLLDDLPFPIKLLHEHYKHGYLTYISAITEKDGQYTCIRCGNHTQRLFASFACARCRETCVYCRKCIMMGRVSQCTPLLSWCGPETPYARRPSLLVWRGELSYAQQYASRRVVQAVNKQEELLLWAVCGAGKTEVLFAGIEKALQKGERVCIASPRIDVITELAPRFARVFPEVVQAALYGGSEDLGKQAQLVLSTTHQLLRFREHFDVMVLDEVDAFPFDTDEMLAYAMKKARKSQSATVYLTATPDERLKQRVRNQNLSAVRIPLRYHGFPLPEPEFQWCGKWREKLAKQKLPALVVTWVKGHCERGKQAFLFVPSIAVMRQVAAALTAVDERIEHVHAEDPDRREKVNRFRKGKIPVLVTTTILERGVTVADIDVAVFGADDDVFSERALVQMAGRVGRSAEAPEGEVCVFHYGKTQAMVNARRHIEEMNDEAFSG